MNWFKKTQFNSDIKELKSSIKKASSDEKMLKYANVAKQSSIDGSDSTKDISVPAKNQDANFFTVFDIQRYVFDSYSVKTALSQTDKKISVSIAANHAFLGTITWDQYWFYDLDDIDKAKETYKKVNQVVSDVSTKFVEANGDLPTPMFWGYLKKECDQIDNEATIRYNIPSINYANQYRHLMEPDWRSNIYGTRYPKYSEDSHKDYNKIRKKLWGI